MTGPCRMAAGQNPLYKAKNPRSRMTLAARKREFLFVDDLADACIMIMKNLDAKDIYEKKISHLNIGSGLEVSIINLANLIKDIINIKSKLVFNTDMPDGMPRKLLDINRINKLGWTATTDLQSGLKITYDWFKNNYNRFI